MDVRRQPPFVFRVDELRPAYNDDAPDENDWTPPRARGSNRRTEEGPYLLYTGIPNTDHSVVLYNYQAQQMRYNQRPDRHSNPQESVLLPVQSYSLYHNRNVFWVISDDASRCQIGALEDDESGSEDDTDPRNKEPRRITDHPWRQIHFSLAGETRHRISCMRADGQNERLHEQWPDQQRWIDRLLPPGYHALPQNRHRRPRTPETQGRGGLCGELALIIGVIALACDEATRRDRRLFTDYMDKCMQVGRWNTDVIPEPVERLNKRGVIVHVFALRTHPSSSNKEILQLFGEGGWGRNGQDGWGPLFK